jgi:hypothetical protein
MAAISSRFAVGNTELPLDENCTSRLAILKCGHMRPPASCKTNTQVSFFLNTYFSNSEKKVFVL